MTLVEPQRADRGHLGDARDQRELPLERRGHVGGHGLRAGAGQAGADLDGREVDLRQRRHRQVEIGDDAEDEQRRGDQRGARSGRRMNGLEMLTRAGFFGRAALARRTLTACRASGHLAVGDHRLAGLEAALDHRERALGHGDHDRPRGDLVVGADHIGEGAVRALVDRRVGMTSGVAAGSAASASH